MRTLGGARTPNELGGLHLLYDPSRFPRYVRELVRAGVAASALAWSGCSEPEPPPSPAPEASAAERLFRMPGYEPLSCESITGAELARTEPVDAITLWRGEQVFLTRGVPCATAADRPACEAAIASFPPGVPEGDLSTFMRITSREGATLFQGRSDASREQLRALIGPIDSVPRAFVWAFMSGRGAMCGEASSVRVEDGRVRMVVTEVSTEGSAGEYQLLEISPNGAFVVRERVPFADPDGVVDGRRPDGLLGSPEAHDLASYLARMAYHEAASVLAFEELAGALASWGAPRALVSACREAALDEVRHAERVGACAAGHGAALKPVEHAPRRARSLLELALENAREGCVRETFGAVAGAYQAEAALDPSIRELMSGIAEDEAEHATLSLRPARWMDARLSHGERAAVRRERASAGVALLRRLEATAEPAYARQLGLPPPPVAAALAARLHADLWA